MSPDEPGHVVFQTRLQRIEQLEEEIQRLKEQLERSRGDGYDCLGGCAHCCTMHKCDCFN